MKIISYIRLKNNSFINMNRIDEENPIPNLEISLYSKRKVLCNVIDKGSIPIKEKTVNYGKNISMNENEILNNPYMAQCCNPKYRKKYFLTVKTFFDFCSKTPLQVIKYIIALPFEYELNGNNIYEKLKDYTDEQNVSKYVILKNLDYKKLIISHYLKDCYKLKPVSSENANDSMANNESLFSHENNQQIWVVC